MCVLAIAFQRIPDCPLLVLENRDESRARPATTPQLHRGVDDRPDWMAGIDKQAGGTWFGINAFGLVVAVTNRPKEPLPAHPRSRGLLCRDLLACKSAAEAASHAQSELLSEQYAGCNVAILSSEAAWLIEAASDMQALELPPGVHVVTNGALNAADDPRLQYVRQQMNAWCDLSCDWKSLISPAQRLLATHSQSDHPAVCLHNNGWGTVSSSVIALPDRWQDAEYWFANGPPCTTPYADCSLQLRELF